MFSGKTNLCGLDTSHLLRNRQNRFYNRHDTSKSYPWRKQIAQQAGYLAFHSGKSVLNFLCSLWLHIPGSDHRQNGSVKQKLFSSGCLSLINWTLYLKLKEEHNWFLACNATSHVKSSTEPPQYHVYFLWVTLDRMLDDFPVKQALYWPCWQQTPLISTWVLVYVTNTMHPWWWRVLQER